MSEIKIISEKGKLIWLNVLIVAILGGTAIGCGSDKTDNAGNGTSGVETSGASRDMLSEGISSDDLSSNTENYADEFPSKKSKGSTADEANKEDVKEDINEEKESHFDENKGEQKEENSGVNSQRDNILDALEKERAYYAEPDYYEKTEAMFELDNEIINNSYYDFSNKLITCIGDSIVAGIGCGVDEEGKQISFARYLEEISGARMVEMMGVAGATMGGYVGDTSVLNRVNDIPDGSDIIVVLAGFNDFINYNGLLGDETCQEGTYTHDVQAIMRTLRDRFPEKDIFVVTTYRNLYEDNPEYSTAYAFDSFLQIQRQYAKEYGIYVIDTHKWGFLDNRDPDIKNAFFSDNIHPNNDGARVLAKHVLAHIIATYAEEGRPN